MEQQLQAPAQPHEAQAEPLIGPALMLLLFAATFLVSAESRMVAPLLPAIASDFQATATRAGVIITAYSLPYGLFQLVYGPLADRFSRQRVIGVSLFLLALGTVFSGFAPTILSLDILRFLSGAAAAGVIPTTMAYIGDAVPYEQRQTALGRLISASSMGGLLSVAIGGIIANYLTWRALFIVYGLIALGVAIVLLRAPVRRARTAQERKPQGGGLLAPYRAVFQAAKARAVGLYTLVFLEGAIALGAQGYLGAFLVERDNVDYMTVGLLMMLIGTASLIASRFVGRIVARIGENGMLLLGGSMLLIGYVLAPLLPMYVFFPIAMLFSGAGFTIAHSTLQTRATELVPSRRGTAVALFAACLFIGTGFGTYVAGKLIDWRGYEFMLLATVAALVVFTAASRPLLRIGRTNKPNA